MKYKKAIELIYWEAKLNHSFPSTPYASKDDLSLRDSDIKIHPKAEFYILYPSKHYGYPPEKKIIQMNNFKK